VLRLYRKAHDTHNPSNEAHIHTAIKINPSHTQNIDQLNYTIRKMIHDFEVHEADEWLKVDGVILNDPHKV